MIKLVNLLPEMQINRPQSNLDLLNKMLSFENNRDEDFILDRFIYQDSFEDWYEENDRYDENSEIVNLAKVFFKWINNGDIIVFRVEDSDGTDEILLSKQYKRVTYYGLGYNDARIILSTF